MLQGKRARGGEEFVNDSSDLEYEPVAAGEGAPKPKKLRRMKADKAKKLRRRQRRERERSVG